MELCPSLSSPAEEKISTTRCGGEQTSAPTDFGNFGELRLSVRHLAFSYDKVSRVRP